MKKITALLLALIMLLSIVACNDEKKNEKAKADLSKYTAGQSEKYKIDSAMYAYFIYESVNTNMYYLTVYGYDSSLPLSKQTTKCAFDESKTWFEFFCGIAENTINQYVAMASAALNANMKLSEEMIKEIDDYIKETDEEAYKQGYEGIEGLLAHHYVEGITKDSFRKSIEIQRLARMYYEDCLSKLETEKFDESVLLDYVNRHPEMFLGIDCVHYTFFGTFSNDDSDEIKAQAYAEAKKKAEDFKNKYTTEEAFKQAIVDKENEGEDPPYAADVILYDFVEKYMIYDMPDEPSEQDKAYYDWAYSKDRKPGDMYLRERETAIGEKYYTVYYITKPSYVEDYITKTARHIFIEVDQDLTGDDLEEAANKAYEKINSIYEEYKNGDMTEASFAALAKKNSEDSNAEEGGIYENIIRDYMMYQFEDWIYDEARKPGDTEIIQTDYGYHLMYFVSDGSRYWEVGAHEGYIYEQLEKHIDDMIAKYPVTYDKKAINKIP